MSQTPQDVRLTCDKCTSFTVVEEADARSAISSRGSEHVDVHLYPHGWTVSADGVITLCPSCIEEAGFKASLVSFADDHLFAAATLAGFEAEFGGGGPVLNLTTREGHDLTFGYVDGPLGWSVISKDGVSIDAQNIADTNDSEFTKVSQLSSFIKRVAEYWGATQKSATPLPERGTFVGPDERGFYTEDCGCRWNVLNKIQCPLHATASELLAAAKLLLEDHQRMEPHHHILCKVCLAGNAAIAKAEPR